MTEDEQAAIRGLREAVDGLASMVGGLTERVTTTEEMQRTLSDQQDVQQTQRRINGWLAASIIFDILLSIGFGFALVRIDSNAEAIDTVQDRTSNIVLCPLYALLVSQADALTPEDADENEDGVITPEEQATLDETVRVIREGYAALECRP